MNIRNGLQQVVEIYARHLLGARLRKGHIGQGIGFSNLFELGLELRPFAATVGLRAQVSVHDIPAPHLIAVEVIWVSSCTYEHIKLQVRIFGLVLHYTRDIPGCSSILTAEELTPQHFAIRYGFLPEIAYCRRAGQHYGSWFNQGRLGIARQQTIIQYLKKIFIGSVSLRFPEYTLMIVIRPHRKVRPVENTTHGLHLRNLRPYYLC